MDKHKYYLGKGKNAFTISSYHQFIITTDNDDPVQTDDDDRRNYVIRSGDELQGNIYYFKTINELIADDWSIAS